jgi:hypothetical protein
MEDNRLFNVAIQEKHWREEEMLRNVKGVKSVVRRRAGPKGRNLEITEKGQYIDKLNTFIPRPPPNSTKAKAAPPYTTFELDFWYLNVLC